MDSNNLLEFMFEANSNQVNNFNEGRLLDLERYAHLKSELTYILANSSIYNVMTLFENRGHEFLEVMENKKSILENILDERGESYPHLILSFLFKYISTHSEQAKALGMNSLHVMVSSHYSYKDPINTLIRDYIKSFPDGLNTRLKGKEDLTPVELAIKTSKDINFIEYMITQYAQRVVYTKEDREKLQNSINQMCEFDSSLKTGLLSIFNKLMPIEKHITNIGIHTLFSYLSPGSKIYTQVEHK
jgi:hypothetical protein